MRRFFHPEYTILCPGDMPLDLQDHEQLVGSRPLAGGLVEYTVVSQGESAA